MKTQIDKLKRFTDHRGYLIELIKGDSIKKLGTLYLIQFDRIGIERGSHYHKKKIESFWIVNGSCRVILLDRLTNESSEFILSNHDEHIKMITIQPNIAHKFMSLEENTIILGYGSTIFDKDNPDTFHKHIHDDWEE